MCNSGCIDFGKENITPTSIEGSRVINIGSLDVNGNMKEYIL